jgi:hypothetical protein
MNLSYVVGHERAVSSLFRIKVYDKLFVRVVCGRWRQIMNVQWVLHYAYCALLFALFLTKHHWDG